MNARFGDAVREARARAWGMRDLTARRARRLADWGPSQPRLPPEWGVNLVGYFHSSLGLGEAARAMLLALDARGVAVEPVHARSSRGVQRASDLDTLAPEQAPYAVNICIQNGDGMRGFLREHGNAFFAGRYSIGVWWWEVIPAPSRWAGVSRSLDEIWVCSDHVRDAIAPSAEVPVLKMPMPVPLPIAGAQDREELGYPDGFVFYSVFDYSSTFARKNPLGVVEAFRRAFSESSGAHLVIRSINGRLDPHNRRRLERAAAGHRDITIVDQYVSSDRRNAMLARCDCYISLHRAEGFGLPLAEAMRLEKPVIATGWSGNLEFMTGANGYLVEYDMSPVGRGCWPYPAHATWAEPRLDHAAALMREVFANREAAAARGRLAARDIHDRHDPQRAGSVLEERLLRIRDQVMSASRHPARISRA